MSGFFPRFREPFVIYNEPIQKAFLPGESVTVLFGMLAFGLGVDGGLITVVVECALLLIVFVGVSHEPAAASSTTLVTTY
ncbi:hypothetical protein Hanom_Chr06g00574671 [Helianthus anomalus]